MASGLKAVILNTKYLGGAASYHFVYDDFKDHIYDENSQFSNRPGLYQLIRYCLSEHVEISVDDGYVYCTLPISKIIPKVNVQTAKHVLKTHGIPYLAKATRQVLLDLAAGHVCDDCPVFVTIIRSISAPTLAIPRADQEDTNFPPDVVSSREMHSVLTAACARFDKRSFEEAGCAVCGLLRPRRDLSLLRNVKNLLHILQAQGVSRQSRRTLDDKIREIDDPILAEHCDSICSDCRGCIRKFKVPPKALCRGFWIGEVPEELSRLNFFEKLLVARVRHTICFVKVTTGMRKMVANVISWSSPVVSVYRILLPPRADMDEVIAIMFTGSKAPTVEDFKRTPFLVNLRHVREALEWLIVNHADYADVTLSEEHLAGYEGDSPPVTVVYRPANGDVSSTEDEAVFDVDGQEGVEAGECPFIVHGICGDDLKSMTVNEMKARALRYFNAGGKAVAVGRSDHPQSIFRNEQLYPQMFPWLFPYGYGGVGSLEGVSDAKHKQHLMLYHDKRFQVDPAFPFVAFSHEQIKTATTRAFLATKRANFDDISSRFLRLDKDALTSVIERLRTDGHVVPADDREKDCYDVIHDLEVVTGPMHGSTTSKKWMRNEIWSLVYHCGSPIWYITLSPADNMHPLCLYYAGDRIDFDNALLPPDARLKLIARNPAACARFFDYMVDVFITEVLGFDAVHKGVYGPVEAYYGTVEQQGRLTLHLHSVLWMTRGLSPTEMREHILDKTSSFQERLVRWLENSHTGGFIGSSYEEVQEAVSVNEDTIGYRNPVLSLPQSRPLLVPKNRKVASNVNVYIPGGGVFERQ